MKFRVFWVVPSCSLFGVDRRFRGAYCLHNWPCSPATRHGGAWAERKYSSYSFTTSVLDGGERSASRPGRAFTPGERTPGTHCTGVWVGPRAGLDTEDTGKILCPCRGSNPDRPVVQPVVRHYTVCATRLLLHPRRY
jgi:hypothetical protein